MPALLSMYSGELEKNQFYFRKNASLFKGKVIGFKSC